MQHLVSALLPWGLLAFVFGLFGTICGVYNDLDGLEMEIFRWLAALLLLFYFYLQLTYCISYFICYNITLV